MLLPNTLACLSFALVVAGGLLNSWAVLIAGVMVLGLWAMAIVRVWRHAT